MPGSTPSMPGGGPAGLGPGLGQSLNTSGAAPVSQGPTDRAWGREWEQIDKMATAWLASGKSAGALLRGDKLAHARQWLASGRGKQPPPKPLHRDFILAGARARSLRIFGVVFLVVVLLGGLGIGGWFLYQREQTEGEGDDGEGPPPTDVPQQVGPETSGGSKGDRARSDALAATAEERIEADPELAALIAVEALAQLPRDDDALDAPAARVLRQALRFLPGRPLRGQTQSVEAVALSPDGRWAITSEAGRSGDVRIWDLDQPGTLTPRFLRGHTKGLTAMRVSADGRWLITADGDGLAQRWDLREPDPSATGVSLAGHRARIGALDLSDDGRWLATGDDTGQVNLWDLSLSLPGPIKLPKGHEGKVTAVAVNAKGTRVVSSGEDMTARNWSINEGRPGRSPVVLLHEEIPVQAVALASDDFWGISGGSDGIVRLWNPRSRIPQRKWIELPAHKRAVTHLETTADSTLAVSVGQDKALVVVNLKAKDPAASPVRMTGHTDRILQLQVLSPPAGAAKGRHAPTTAFTASADGTARSWNLDRRSFGIESRVFGGHEGGVRSVGASGDGQWAITGGDGGLARVWDWQSLPLATAEPDGSLPRVGSASIVARGHAQAVTPGGVDRVGRHMVTGSADGTARIWDLRQPARVVSLPVNDMHQSTVHAVAVSPNARYGVTGDDSGNLIVWDITADRPLGLSLKGHTGEIRALVFNGDGSRLVSISTDRTARVWRMNSKDPNEGVVELPHRDEVIGVALSGDGRRLLTGTLSAAVLWDLSSDKPGEGRRFAGHEDDITAVALGPSGRWAATGSADHRALLYDLRAKGAPAFKLRGHEETIRVMAFHPRGKWLATGGGDKTIRLWDLASDYPDENARVLSGHEQGINDLVWSLDGRWLVSASNDGTVRLWDSRKPFEQMVEQAIVLEGHRGVIRQVGLVPGDGDRGLRSLVTASYDQTARLWPLEAPALARLGCTHVGRALSEDEWETYVGGSYAPACGG